ncbi:S8 family serine peptidase [Flavobacterium mesophilum]|uniref:S8 family serine peptidase n=1 Tax=Flavobacterium mesophilum TaxID=3143495 RepID=UPI0031DC3E80
MRNWHTKVIKLDDARTYISQHGLNQLGDSNLHVGVMEGSIQYVPADNSSSINENNNYNVPNRHLNNGTGEKKVIYRKKIDRSFYDDNLTIDVNDKIPLTHTTSVAGVIAGREIINLNGNNDNVFGVCPNAKIINTSGNFENSLILSGINNYTKGNLSSIYYSNEVIKDKDGDDIKLKDYFSIEQRIIPDGPQDGNNIYNQRKSSIISCSFSWPNDPTIQQTMPPEITDFVMKELLAYGRDGRGVLTVFAAGNDSKRNPELPFTLSNKPLIVAASKVILDKSKLDLYTSPSNPIEFNEDHADYTNYGSRIDICAPSSPKGKSGEKDIEIFAPTMINSGEVGETDQLFETTILKKKSSNKLILESNLKGIFPGQSIEIGDPTTFFHEIRFITKIETVQEPVNVANPKQNLRVQVTLDSDIFFTNELTTSTANFTIVGAPVRICVFKKNILSQNGNQLNLDNMNGIGEFQTPKQEAYIYSENDIQSGQLVSIRSSDHDQNFIVIDQILNSSLVTNLKLIPGQIHTIIKRDVATTPFFKAATGSSLKGFFTGQQVSVQDNSAIKRHIKFITKPGNNLPLQMQFSQFNVVSDEDGKLEYTIKSLAYGNLTNSFGGTSSATPLISGVSALLLSVNPKLNVPEIKHILKEKATKITGESEYDLITDNTKYNYNYTTNKYFGTGRVNAEAAVRLALNWHATVPSEIVMKPKLEIADKLSGLGVWVSDSTVLPTETKPLNTIDTSKPQKIYVKIKNSGERESFKECDLRVLIAFTDQPNPTFKFPDYWYNQTDVKLLSVKEIPIIPPHGETTIEIEWKDIAAFWQKNNPSRKKAYILAHIAPFDGLDSEVMLDNINNNKQLSCKKLIVSHNEITNGSAYILGTKLNITVGPDIIEKSFDLKMENTLAVEIEKLQIKATKRNRENHQLTKEVVFQKTETNWALTGDSSGWIEFQTPTETVSLDEGYKNIIFPHKLTINDDEDEIKLEIINVNA